MSDRLLVATRKGLFEVKRGSGGWAISGPSFLGDPVSIVFPDPRDGTVYAALALSHFGVKLHRSYDGGKSWEECSAPSYPNREAEEPRQRSGPSEDSVTQIWCLEAAGEDSTGELWAGTIPGGLFRSSDRGSSWELNRSLWERPERTEWFGGGYSQPGIHSICVNPRDPGHVTLAVSCGGVWVTLDGGGSWECRARGMKADYMPPQRQQECAVQDPHRLVQCAASPEVLWVQHHNGVFRSTDGAVSWRQIFDAKPSTFGFAVAVHPQNPEVAWLVPGVSDECRVPVQGRVVVSRTRDGGRSFEVLREGLPQENAFDIVYRHGLDVDSTGERLAMGSTTGSLWISEDGGDSWQTVSCHLPPVHCLRFVI
ncbi:MAG: exo-alpha-sialidase [Acidobacteriota bacterium]